MQIVEEKLKEKKILLVMMMVTEKKKINYNLQKILNHPQILTNLEKRKIKIKSLLKKINDDRSYFWRFTKWLIIQRYEKNEIKDEELKEWREIYSTKVVTKWIRFMRDNNFLIWDIPKLVYRTTFLFQRAINKPKIPRAINKREEKENGKT